MHHDKIYKKYDHFHTQFYRLESSQDFDKTLHYSVVRGSGSHIFTVFGQMTHMCHDHVIKWKHFPRCWQFVRGIHRSPVNSPHKGQWRGALMFSLICVWIKGWVNNRKAGDSRRYRSHYDVIVMFKSWVIIGFNTGVSLGHHQGIISQNANLALNLFTFSSNFTEICSQLSNLQNENIDSHNGLARNLRQASQFYWRIYALVSRDELTLSGIDTS